MSAARSLGNLGEQAEVALPLLARALADEELREAAAAALGKIGPPSGERSWPISKPASYDALRSRTSPPQLKLGGASKDVYASAVALLDHKTANVRAGAAYVLWSAGQAASSAVPGMERALTDEDKRVRKYAALALGESGRKAASAAPALQKLLKDKDAAVRAAAARAYWRTTGDRDKVEPVMVVAMKSTDWHARLLVCMTVGEFGAAGEGLIPALTDVFSTRDRLLCHAITESLVKMGPKARPAAKAQLEKLLGASCSWFHVDTAYALWRVTGETDKSIPKLLKILCYDDRDLPKRAAAAALAEMGSAATQALPAMKKVLENDGRKAVCQDISRAMAMIRGKTN